MSNEDAEPKTLAEVGELVVGAYLRDSTARPSTRTRYALGLLAAVMAVWIEQPHRSWLKRELAQATNTGRGSMERILQDLVAAGHAVAAESPRIRGHRYRVGSYVLTPEGMAVWSGVDLLQVERRYVPPHMRARPRTPQV